MNCKVCGGALPTDRSGRVVLGYVDGLCTTAYPTACFLTVRRWAHLNPEFVMPDKITDPRWLVTIDAYLEAHPPQREE